MALKRLVWGGMLHALGKLVLVPRESALWRAAVFILNLEASPETVLLVCAVLGYVRIRVFCFCYYFVKI